MPLERDVGKLAPLAIAIVSLTVIVGVGAIVLTEMESNSYADVAVTAETDQPSSPFPSNYTLDGSTEADYVQVRDGTVTVTYEDSSAGTNTTLTEDTDYNVYYEAGEVEVQNTTVTEDYDSASDQFYTDYEYEEESTATSVLGLGTDALSTFGDFFTVIVVIGIAAVLFLLLGAVKKSGGKTMA